MSDICELLRGRWSPRQYDQSRLVSEEEINLLLEAARWAPSARNIQPWKFIIAPKGGNTYDRVKPAVEGNSDWALTAPLLVVNVVDMEKNARRGEYDLNAAVQHMLIQAEAMGLHGRIFASFDIDLIKKEFGLPEGLRPLTMTAFGVSDPGIEKPNRTRESIESMLIN